MSCGTDVSSPSHPAAGWGESCLWTDVSSMEESGIVQDSKAGGQLGDPSVSVRPSVVRGWGAPEGKARARRCGGWGKQIPLASLGLSPPATLGLLSSLGKHCTLCYWRCWQTLEFMKVSQKHKKDCEIPANLTDGQVFFFFLNFIGI